MKKLIITSIFALGFMVSFANNGQKELELEKFNVVTPENQSTVVEFQEFSASSIATYELVVWIYICDGENGTSYGLPLPTAYCIDSTQLATLKAMYESIYWIYNPDSCRIEVRETLIEECE